MQELFSQLETEHSNLFNLRSVDGRKFINDYYKFLELEKQQIIDAFDVACEDQNRIGIEYFNQTFNKQ